MVPFTYFSNHSLPSFGDPQATAPRSDMASNPHLPNLVLRSRFRHSIMSQSTPPQDVPPRGSPLKQQTRSSRWHRRSRPVFGSLGKTTAQREVELGVCMIDDGWALLVHPKSEAELPPTPPHSPDTLAPPPLPPKALSAPPRVGTSATTFSTYTSSSEASSDTTPLFALEGKRSRDPTPTGLNARVNLPGHNLHNLDKLQELNMIPPRCQSLHPRGPPVNASRSAPTPPVSAFLRPPPGRPVSVITPPATQAPVSVLRRQSLPPGLDTGPRTSIKFADEPISTDIAAREVTVASLNETLRLRRSYASLQSRHAQLYDAALDARNEISRLRSKLTHTQDVMEHLIAWGLAMQTENEVLREQIPDAANTVGPVSVKTADELRALFDHNLEEDEDLRASRHS